MKRIMMLTMVLVVMLVSLEGCFWGYERHGRDGGYNRGGHDDQGGGHDNRGGGHDHGGDHDDRNQELIRGREADTVLRPSCRQNNDKTLWRSTIG
jgi:hypothetical protein